MFLGETEEKCNSFFFLLKPFNPIALRMAKTLQSFGHSECNRVIKFIYKYPDGGYFESLYYERTQPHTRHNFILIKGGIFIGR